MKTYQNNENAPYGLYLSFRRPDIRFVGADGESLEGVDGATYRRLPTPLVVAAGPVLGGLFVIAFPVLIILATIVGLGRLITTRVRATADEHAYLASGRYEPSMAYLNKGEGEGEDAELADLEKEVETARADEAGEKNEEQV